MTFVKLALCVACIAGLGMVAYSGNGGAWLNARLMDKNESTPPTTSALFATGPADVLFSATRRVELTRMPFAEFKPHRNGTETVQARLEHARATNARNEASRESKAKTQVVPYWAAKASPAGRPAQRPSPAARRLRRAEENRLPRRSTDSSQQQRDRNPRYIGRSF